MAARRHIHRFDGIVGSSRAASAPRSSKLPLSPVLAAGFLSTSTCDIGHRHPARTNDVFPFFLLYHIEALPAATDHALLSHPPARRSSTAQKDSPYFGTLSCQRVRHCRPDYCDEVSPPLRLQQPQDTSLDPSFPSMEAWRTQLDFLRRLQPDSTARGVAEIAVMRTAPTMPCPGVPLGLGQSAQHHRAPRRRSHPQRLVPQ